MATEIELKLRIIDIKYEDHLSGIKSCLERLGIEGSFQAYHLSNTYFDTVSLELNALKIALRIRHKKSGECDYQVIQTLKTKGTSLNGLSQRGEWEWRLATHSLDESVLLACKPWPKHIKTEDLAPLFETNFTRTQVEFDYKQSRIELALDDGEIKSFESLESFEIIKRIESIKEIELELKRGNKEDLILLSKELNKTLTLAPSDISKAERGYRLISLSKASD